MKRTTVTKYGRYNEHTLGCAASTTAVVLYYRFRLMDKTGLLRLSLSTLFDVITPVCRDPITYLPPCDRPVLFASFGAPLNVQLPTRTIGTPVAISHTHRLVRESPIFAVAHVRIWKCDDNYVRNLNDNRSMYRARKRLSFPTRFE